MGNAEKLMNQIMELKFTPKSLQCQAQKYEKDEKSEKFRVKNSIEKGKDDDDQQVNNLDCKITGVFTQQRESTENVGDDGFIRVSICEYGGSS
ncbi:hypothetical protein RDI58_020025 [Solanum bulbocastanum]|uniref:Uncharacterized protein n=1 Tax=Solanum bulbocastanum TaxID=147425 RepID=A0AAN8Y7I1_SOLBU